MSAGSGSSRYPGGKVDYRAMTRAYARKWGIPEDLAVAQIGAESGFNPRAVSPAGARGLAQFMPATARGVGLRDPFNPQQSLDAYGKHMSTLLKNYKGNKKLALAAYNAGGGAVSKYGGIPPYAETRGYVSKIMSQVAGGTQTGTAPQAPAAKRGAGGGATAVQAAGGSGSLQLDPATMKMIQKWVSSQDKAIAAGDYGRNDKLWNKIVNKLQTLPRPAAIPANASMGAGAAQRVGNAASSAASVVADAAGGKLRPILPGQPAWGSYGYSDPEGQGGKHMAVDWFAKNGTPVKAPISGKIVRLSASKGNSGQVFGGVVSIRDKNGRLFVMRHIDPGKLRVGQKVGAGQVVGTPTAWTGGSHHIHFEAYGKGSSDREYGQQYAMNPKTLYG